MEPLENRVLLAAPVFGTPMPDDLTVPLGGAALTVGIDGEDDDGDALTITVTSDDPDLVAFVPTGNRFARMVFVESDGVTPIGEVIFEIFEDRGGEAAERFIIHSTTGFDEEGEVDPLADPFFTDVIVHRIFPGFVIQTGDAENGNGTGGSPLGQFPDDFDEILNFALEGVIAMANSGPNTNGSQFFITDGAATHLDQVHMIFGQVVSGFDVITDIINRPRDGSDRPLDPPLLKNVDIFTSTQDATVTLIPDNDNWDGKATVTVTLDDGNGGIVTHDIEVTKDFGFRPMINITTVNQIPPEGGTIGFSIIDDGVHGLDAQVTHNGPPGTIITVSEDPDGPDDFGIPYKLDVTVPDGFFGVIDATITAIENNVDPSFGFTPTEANIKITTLGERPTITGIPDDVRAAAGNPGDPFSFTPTIADDQGQDITVAVSDDSADVDVTIDPDTFEVTIVGQSDFKGTFEITITAIETAADGLLDERSVTFQASTLGDPPVIVHPNNPDDPDFDDRGVLRAEPGQTITLDRTEMGNVFITDDSDLPLDVSVENITDGALAFFADDELVIQVDDNFVGGLSFDLVAVEDGFDGVGESRQRVYVQVGTDEDAAAYGHVPIDRTDAPQKTIIDGDRMYVANGTTGLEIWDIADVTAHTLLGSIDLPGTARDVAVMGDHAFVTTGTTGLHVLDISDPSDITIVSVAGVGFDMHDIEISGYTAFVAENQGGVAAYEIGDPMNVHSVGRIIELSGGLIFEQARGLLLADDILYVTDLSGKVVALKVSDPTNMKDKSLDAEMSNPFGMDLVGDLLYVADGEGGLAVFDTKGKGKLKLENRVLLGDDLAHVSVVNNVAVLSSRDQGGFVFVDVSVLESAFIQSVFQGAAGPGAMAKMGAILALPTADSGIFMVDTSVFEMRNLIEGKSDFVVSREVDIGGGVMQVVDFDVQLKIKGDGAGQIVFEDGMAGIERIDIFGASEKTNFDLKIKNDVSKDVLLPLGEIFVGGGAKKFSIDGGRIMGNVTIDGKARKIDIVDGRGEDAGGTPRDIRFTVTGGITKGSDKVDFSFRNLDNVSLNVPFLPINKLQGENWLDFELTPDDQAFINTTSINKLSLDNRFEVDVFTSGLDGNRYAVNKADIGGDINESRWTLSGGDLNKFSHDALGDSFSIIINNGDANKIDFGDLFQGSLNVVNGSINKLSAIIWDQGTVTARHINQMDITGDKKTNRIGMFNAALNATGLAGENYVINKFSAEQLGRDLNVTWNLAGEFNSIDIDRQVISWTLVMSSGSISSWSLPAIGILNLDVSNGTIGSLDAYDWNSGAIITQTLDKLKITGNAKMGVEAFFGARINAMANDVKYGIREIDVAGDIGRDGQAVEIRSASSIKQIAAQRLIDSDVIVGLKSADPTTLTLSTVEATGIDSFTPEARINLVELERLTLTGNDMGDPSFVNSFVAAIRIGQVELHEVELDNDGVPFGFAATANPQQLQVLNGQVFDYPGNWFPDPQDLDVVVIPN